MPFPGGVFMPMGRAREVVAPAKKRRPLAPNRGYASSERAQGCVWGKSPRHHDADPERGPSWPLPPARKRPESLYA